ncbi:hypothetical protein [Candidatus Vondammii sp. HM_W22]|uniref:hypothetical protein n=1 Tax=Candidatus Vondammii sp. HM_W22 TaxID=2687299 RepID=UPI001F149265|nr:hypothetical protein [Candidatus Vondammii sp. HM_W22]
MAELEVYHPAVHDNVQIAIEQHDLDWEKDEAIHNEIVGKVVAFELGSGGVISTIDHR